MNLPEFDFSSYNARDPWSFPPQRLTRFAAEASALVKPYRNQWAIKRPYPDIRFVVFHEIHGSLHAAHALAAMMQQHVLDAGWWQENSQSSKQPAMETMQANHINLREFLLSGLVHAWLRSIDHAFRQLLSAIDPESTSRARSGPRKLAGDLLEKTGLQDREAVVHILRLIQESTGTGGKFCPPNGKDLNLHFRGRLFHFKNQEPLEGYDHGFIDTWDWLLFLLRELCQLLQNLFDHPHIKGIPVIKAKYLG